MSHEAHSDASTGKTHTKVSFSSSFWLVIVLVFLFIGTLNFIQAVSSSSEEHATTEHAHGAGHEATHGEATHGEATHGEATHGEATHGEATHEAASHNEGEAATEHKTENTTEKPATDHK